MKGFLLVAIMMAATISRADETNIVYYPPQDDSIDIIPDFSVTAGDALNVTWSCTYQVDLYLKASAQYSNLTNATYYNPGFDAQSFCLWTFHLEYYLINDTSKEIQAYFLLTDSADSTQFVKSQNFTVKQPKEQSINSQGQITIPVDASTWAGSVTLLTSQACKQFVTGTLDSVSLSVATSPLSVLSTSSIVSTLASPLNTNRSDFASSTSAQSVFPQPTSITASANATASAILTWSDSLNSGTKAGIGLGATAGFLLIAALIILSILLARSRRKSDGKPRKQPFGLVRGLSKRTGDGLEHSKNVESERHNGMQSREVNEVDGSGPGLAQGGVGELDGGDRRCFGELESGNEGSHGESDVAGRQERGHLPDKANQFWL